MQSGYDAQQALPLRMASASWRRRPAGGSWRPGRAPSPSAWALSVSVRVGVTGVLQHARGREPPGPGESALVRELRDTWAALGLSVEGLGADSVVGVVAENRRGCRDADRLPWVTQVTDTCPRR